MCGWQADKNRERGQACPETGMGWICVCQLYEDKMEQLMSKSPKPYRKSVSVQCQQPYAMTITICQLSCFLQPFCCLVCNICISFFGNGNVDMGKAGLMVSLAAVNHGAFYTCLWKNITMRSQSCSGVHVAAGKAISPSLGGGHAPPAHPSY